MGHYTEEQGNECARVCMIDEWGKVLLSTYVRPTKVGAEVQA